MKWFTLASLAGAVILCGCASTNADSDSAKYEEKYVPLGTLIARKDPSRADNVKSIDKQSLENDRTMGGGSLDGSRSR